LILANREIIRRLTISPSGSADPAHITRKIFGSESNFVNGFLKLPPVVGTGAENWQDKNGQLLSPYLANAQYAEEYVRVLREVTADGAVVGFNINFGESASAKGNYRISFTPNQNVTAGVTWQPVISATTAHKCCQYAPQGDSSLPASLDLFRAGDKFNDVLTNGNMTLLSSESVWGLPSKAYESEAQRQLDLNRAKLTNPNLQIVLLNRQQTTSFLGLSQQMASWQQFHAVLSQTIQQGRYNEIPSLYAHFNVSIVANVYNDAAFQEGKHVFPNNNQVSPQAFNSDLLNWAIKQEDPALMNIALVSYQQKWSEITSRPQIQQSMQQAVDALNNKIANDYVGDDGRLAKLLGMGEAISPGYLDIPATQTALAAREKLRAPPQYTTGNAAFSGPINEKQLTAVLGNEFYALESEIRRLDGAAEKGKANELRSALSGAKSMLMDMATKGEIKFDRENNQETSRALFHTPVKTDNNAPQKSIFDILSEKSPTEDANNGKSKSLRNIEFALNHSIEESPSRALLPTQRR